MFNRDFYPTPDAVIAEMLSYIKLNEDSVILDPSAGKGNILDYIKKKCVHKDMYAIEINSELRSLLNGKGYHVIANDFLQVNAQQITGVNKIVMNPPFSLDVKHILHAYEIAPQGCEIVALLNSNSLSNTYSKERVKLKNLINEVGGSRVTLGKVFDTAERRTDVEVDLIHIRKTKGYDDSFDYSGFFLDNEEDAPQGYGILSYNEVRAIVNNYVSTLQSFDRMQKELDNINKRLQLVLETSYDKLTLTFGYEKNFTTKDKFIKELQRESWNAIFTKLNVRKYLTTQVQERMDKFIEMQHDVPFTERNVYHMLNILYQTRNENMQLALVEAVDNFTRHTHDNRYHVEGWKTNAGHMLNKRFIVENGIRDSYSNYYRIDIWNRQGKMIEDLIRILCVVTGVEFDSITPINQWVTNEHDTGIWYPIKNKDGENIFMDFRFYKKRSVHFRFTDLKAWEDLNRMYAKIKGQKLPEKL